jgi:purine-binding chemotaxis protein CheW
MEALKIVDETLPSQLIGFRIGDDTFGIPVVEVQEVIKHQRVTPIPLAQQHIRGLVNLRGQIVTSISLRSLFGLEDTYPETYMNVIVNNGKSIYALAVDEILDVIEVKQVTFESTPKNMDQRMQEFTRGVFKLDGDLMVLLNVQPIVKD